MHIWKKFISFILVLCMVAGFLPASALGVAWNVTRTVDTTYVENPLYSDAEPVVTQEVQPVTWRPFGNSAEYLTDLEAAAAVLRAGMVAREKSIVVYYEVDASMTNDEVSQSVWDQALAHTGVPDEGDYQMWHWGSYRCSRSYDTVGDRKQYELTYTITYYTTAEQEAEVDVAVKELLTSLELDGLSDYEQLVRIYDWICENVVYDYYGWGEYKHTAHAAIIGEKAVCQGYASLLYRLLLTRGIDCRVISGDGGGPHGWNIVNLDGWYFDVDSTWDASYAQADLEYEYFLRSEENFQDHIRDAEYDTEEFHAEYPMSKLDYPEDGHKHVFEMTQLLPTCTEDGNREYVCTVCEGVCVEILERLGHDLDGNYYCGRCEQLIVYMVECGLAVENLILIDGTYYTPQGKRAMIALDAPLDWLYGDTLRDYVAYWGSTYFSMTYWDQLFAAVNADGYVPLTEETYVWLLDLITGNPAWGENADALTHYVGYYTQYIAEDDHYAFGVCGDSAYYAFNRESGALSLAGSGVIWEFAFGGREDITALTIGGSITQIGDFAFHGCTGLTELTLPANVHIVNWKAFAGCTGLTHLNLCNQWESTGLDVFSGCTDLEEVWIHSGNSVRIHQEFGEYLRLFDNAQRLYIESSLTDVSEYMSQVLSCNGATETVEVDGVRYVLYTKKAHNFAVTSEVAATCTEGGQISYQCADCGYGYVQIVAAGHSYDENRICSACGDKQFYMIDCGLRLEDLVLQDGAYYTADGKPVMLALNIPLDHLDGYTLREMVNSYGGSAFSMTYWDQLKYQYNSSGYVDLTEEILTWVLDLLTENPAWGEDAEDLTHYIGCVIRYTGSCGSKLTYVLDLDTGLLTIEGTGAIYSYSFSGWNDIQHVVIGDGVTEIGGSAFKNCSNLRSISIPETVATIGYSAFSGCSSLEEITIPSGVTLIENSTFSGCSSLNSISIPASVTSIGYSAFEDCAGLTEVILADGLVSIGDYAFENCSSLLEITIPDTVTTLGNYAFRGCTALKRAYIGNGVTVIDQKTFSQCSNLESVRLPDGLTQIKNYAFESCSSLTSVTIPGSVTTIGQSTFAYCTDLTTVVFEAGAATIGEFMFYQCANLTTVVLPDSVTYVDYAAFSGCENLWHVLYQGTEEQWNSVILNGDRKLKEAIRHYNCIGNEVTKMLESLPTCTEGGAFIHSCSICGESQTNSIEALGHDWMEATCVEPKTCKVCGATEGDAGSGSHSWDNGTVTELPTCDQQGVKTYSCTVCGATETERIDALGHSYAGVVTEPTCTEGGYTTYTCAVCGDSYAANETAALGHDFGDWYDAPGEENVQRRDCQNPGCDHFETQSTASSGVLGDVDGDGDADSTDAMWVLRYDAWEIEDDELDLSMGDVDGDGDVDSTDAMWILRYDAWEIDGFPAETLPEQPEDPDTTSIADGDKVKIYYPDGGTYITSTAFDKKLAPGSADEAAVWTVSVDANGFYTFICDGKYLTSGETGNQLFLTDAASDYSLWELIACENGYYLRNVNAAYNGNTNQYLDFYYGFTTYGFDESRANIYTFQFEIVG